MNANKSLNTTPETTIRNFFFLAGSRFLAPLISIVLMGYISRTLGTVGLGEYNLIVVTFNIFLVPAHLGLVPFIIREIANKRKTLSDIYLSFTILGLVSSILMSIGMVIYACFSGYDLRLIWLFMIAAIGLLPNTLLIYHLAIAAAREKFHVHAALLMAERFVRVIFGIILLYAGYALIGVMVGYSFSIFLALGLSFLLLRKQFKNLRKNIDFSIMSSFLKIAPTFLMISMASTVFWKIDVLMLAKLKGMQDVGFYTAAYRLMEITFTLLLSFTVVVFPIAAKLFHYNKKEFSNFCTRNIKYLLVISSPVVLVTCFAAKEILTIIYGSELQVAANALVVLILTLIPFGPTMILANALTAGDKQSLDLAIVTMSMVFNIGANLIIIPRYGFKGAAFTTLFSVVFMLILQVAVVSRSLYRPVISLEFFKPLFAALLMFVCMYSLNNLSIFLRSLFGLIIYISMILVLRTFTHDEMARIRKIRLKTLIEVR